VRTSGIITETEAYSFRERGCHAYAGKMTPRNKVMFEEGGVAYVYLCYGIHYLFNIVSNREGIAEAVLIRGIYPLEGISHALMRRNKETFRPQHFMGPGNVTRALGISRGDDGTSLVGEKIWLEDAGYSIQEEALSVTKRIGIDYAGEDALLPWRFLIKDPARTFGL
jgi:DNA-3-methyladenine glycosylase